MMDIVKVSDLIKELSLQIDCSKYEIVDCLVGMVLGEEEANQIKEKLSGR